MWESSEILCILEQNSTQLRQMGVRKIGLFGSYRRGTPASESDMDFLDLFDCRVDLVMEESLKPRLRSYILAEVAYAQGP